MNDKKDSSRGITDEEKEALFSGSFDPLQLSSFSEALQDKSSAFKAYLAIITTIMVFVFLHPSLDHLCLSLRSSTLFTLLMFRFIKFALA